MPVYRRSAGSSISERYGTAPDGAPCCGQCKLITRVGENPHYPHIGICPAHEYVHITAEVCDNFES